MRRLLLVPALALTLCLPSWAQTGPNLQENGDFESGPWGAEGDARAAQVDMLVSHGGSQSAKLEARADAERYVYGPALAVEPGSNYLLTVWVKCDGVTDPSGVHLRFLQWDDAKPLGWVWNWQIGQGIKEFIRTGGTRNWTRYAAVLKRLDPAARRIAPFLAIGPGAGTAWIDDVDVRKLEGEGVPAHLAEPLEEPAGPDGRQRRVETPPPALPAEFDLAGIGFPARNACGGSGLLNGDFEQPVPPDWAKHVVLDADVKHGGGTSLALSVGNGMVARMPDVDPDLDYRLTAWVRTRDVPRNGLRLRLWPGWWNEQTMGEDLVVTGGTQDWTEYQIVMNDIPAGLQGKAWWLHYDLAAGEAGAQPAAWLDDVRIEPLADSVRVSSAKPGHLFTEGEQAQLEYVVRRVSQGDTRRVRWAAADFWGGLSEQGSIDLAPDAEGTARASIALPRLGYHRLVLVLQDAEGAALQGQDVSAGVLPKPADDAPAPRPESVFACWGVPAEMAPPLGIRWTRWMERGTDFTPVDGDASQFSWTLKQYYGDYRPREARQRERDAGLTTYLCFAGFPEWMRKGEDGSLSPVPRDWQRFSDWVGFVYRQVADLVPVVEVWNEPVIPWGWQGTPEDIVALHRAVCKAVKAINPDVKVIGPCDTTEHLDTFGRLGGFEWIDAVSIHPYRAGSPEATDFIGGLRQVKAVAAKYGQEPELWITEMGWTTAPGRFTELEQANWIVRAYVQALGEGVRSLNVHIFRDWNNSSASEKYFGITRTDGSPKPAAIGYATMTRNLEGARYVSRMDWLGRAGYGYVFDAGGAPLLVLWNAAADGVPARVPVDADRVRVERLDGTSEHVACADGWLETSLGQSPVFITGASAGLYLAQDSGMLATPDRAVEVVAGDEVELPIAVHNSTAKAVEWELRATAPVPLTVGQTGTSIALEPGATRTVQVRVTASADALAQGYPVFTELWSAGRAIARKTATVTVSPALRLGELTPDFATDLTPAINVTAANSSRRALSGTLELSSPGFVATSPEMDVALEPGESKVLSFAVSGAAPLGRPCRVQALFRETTGTRSSLETTTVFMPCRRASGAVAIDGDLREWTGTPMVQVGADWPVMNPTLYRGEGDCSAQFGCMWDDGHLYVALRVHDDVFLQEMTGSAVWGQDSVQIGLDPAPGKQSEYNPLVGAFGKGLYEYGLSLTQAGPQVWRWCSGDPKRLPAESADTAARLSVVRDGPDVVYEAELPWQSLGVERPEPGCALGLALAVNDDDGDGRKAILWFDGIVHSKDPSQYGRLTLVGG